MTWSRWKISARIERVSFMIQNHRHRPATMAGHCHRDAHINRIDIRALLAINLDRHEVRIQVVRDGLILK